MTPTFSESDLTTSPFDLFENWFSLAKSNSGFDDPNATALSTIDESGYPDSRMVLLKSFDESGFVFFTNSLSKKGKALAKIPKASMLFYWDSLKRQIRIQGDISKVEDSESDKYFASRSRESQIGAWASNQSEELNSRGELEQRAADFAKKFDVVSVPRPEHWFGFRLAPRRMEFWQEGKFRLHDRFVYILTEESWKVQRLNP